MADTATMGEVARALGFTADAAKLDQRMSLGTFRKEWNELTENDKTQLKAGVHDGSMSY